MKENKNFDCVEMKHRAAEKLQQHLQGKTLHQQVSFWQQRTEELKMQKKNLSKKHSLENVS